MAYNEKLAERVREMIGNSGKKFEEKKMFGGICFMVNDKMCAGVDKDQLMVRLDPGLVEQVVEMEGCSQMEMAGKPMKGFVWVEGGALGTKTKLQYWLDLALDYNPVAKTSKKKKKKK